MPPFYLPPVTFDPILIRIVLFLGACTGHTFFLVTSLNVMYGWPWPRNFLRISRKLDVLFVLGGPLLFLVAVYRLGATGLHWDGGVVHNLFTSYMVFCWAVGFAAAPIAMTMYWLRRTPKAVLSVETTMVDVQRELGFPPIGLGKERRLAMLPGNQVFEVDFDVRTFHLPQIPAEWDGLSILHLTDLHLCGTPDREFYQYVFDRCMEQGEPDIVALTGDVVDSDEHHKWVVPLMNRLRWKEHAFAILGNHDQWHDPQYTRRRLAKAKVSVLGNTWQQVVVRGQPMIVVGNEMPWFTPAPDLADCPSDIFRFCLSHTPDTIKWAKQNAIDLVLAGHVHGGQIRFPLIGSVFVPSRYSRRYDRGTFYEKPTLMHVGRGLAGQHPLRYLCRPEVSRIILRKNQI